MSKHQRHWLRLVVDINLAMEQDGKVTNLSQLQDQPEESGQAISLSNQDLPGDNDFPDYGMSHGRKAYIFNHDEFKLETRPVTEESRHGSSKDRDDLKDTLEFLNFQVESFDNLTAEKFRETIDKLATKVDYSDCDCLLVVVLSHGENGKIYANDLPQTYDVKEVWAPFMPTTCPSLAGKPKLFFIQACRAFENEDIRFDEGTAVSYSAISDGPETTTYTIPTQADFLFAYSTIPGYASIRDVNSGSLFIQTLCKTLLEQGKTEDLLSILTQVLREVATDVIALQQRVAGTIKRLKVVQMPCFTTQLIRKVYFRDPDHVASNFGKGLQSGSNQ